MTKELEEYKARLDGAVEEYDVYNEFSYSPDFLIGAAQALLRVIDALGDEKDEDSDTNVGMMSLGRVRGYNALRQQIIDAILNTKKGN